MLTPAEESLWTREAAAHLLNRAGFGGTPAEIDRLHDMGRARAVESLIDGQEDAARFPLPEWMQPEQLRTLAGEMMDSRRKIEGMTDEKEKEEQRRRTIQNVIRRQREQALELTGWWFGRMAGTAWPLREKMTLFWHGHFATSLEKVRQVPLMARQNELFRRHALGSFRDLTGDIVEDPAMMVYLDTNTSRREHPNENFARELMELFTLGEGNYTEDDVKEGARASTGYVFRPVMLESRFVPFQHDDGEKTFLGEKGRWNGRDIVNIIFRKPQCAKFITAKLWRFFVSDTLPEPALHEALAAALQKAEWRLSAFLRTLFNAAEFYSPAVMRAQIKSPVQFLVQLRKQLELKSPVPPVLLAGTLQQLGQVLFRPPNVAGWEGGRAWINTSTLLMRYNVAGAVATGDLSGLPAPQRPNGGNQPPRVMERVRERMMARGGAVKPDWQALLPQELRSDGAKLLDALVWRLYNGPIPEKDRAKFADFAKEKSEGGLTDDELAHLVHVMLSTPQYQVC